ncbi:hypothetical protein Tco_0683869 [Tanacetum coccineum]
MPVVKDLSKSLLGRVKQFVSLANLRKAVSNERFVDIKIQYMGELWVLLEFGSEDSMKLFQDNVSIGSWFSQLKQATMENTIKEEIAWLEEHKDKQEKNSEDPFNIYKLLKKKKDTTENEINSEQTMKYPPGFTPKEGSEEIGMYAEESKSVNFVNLSDHKAEEADKMVMGGSILNLMDELVKVGQVMGYKMDGCMSNMTEIIESQGVKERRGCLGNFAFDYVHKILSGNSGRMKSMVMRRLLTKERSFVNNIQKFDKIHSSEMAQKAKVKWSIEGDGKYYFFMACGKGLKFFQHFQYRCDKTDAIRATINMNISETLTYGSTEMSRRDEVS